MVYLSDLEVSAGADVEGDDDVPVAHRDCAVAHLTQVAPSATSCVFLAHISRIYEEEYFTRNKVSHNLCLILKQRFAK